MANRQVPICRRRPTVADRSIPAMSKLARRVCQGRSMPSASRPSIIRQPRDVTGAAAGPSSDPRSRRAPSRWRASGGEPHSRMRTREACERVWFQIGARRANKTVAPPPLVAAAGSRACSVRARSPFVGGGCSPRGGDAVRCRSASRYGEPGAAVPSRR